MFHVECGARLVARGLVRRYGFVAAAVVCLSVSRVFWLVGSTTALVTRRASLSSLPDPVILELLFRVHFRSTPQRPLLREPSTAVGQDLYKSVIHLSFFRRQSLSLPSFPQQRPRTSTSAGSLGHSSPY